MVASILKKSRIVYNPHITIAIVCFNSEDTIRDTLNSIYLHRASNTELVIVDGGSTDATLNIINEYSAMVSYLVSEPDQGIYDAMNKCLKLASGNWILFLGSDDLLVSDLNTIQQHLIETNTTYYGNAIFRSNNAIYDGKFNKLKIFYKNICHQSIFYPISIYKNYNYNLKFKIRADHAYNIEILLSSKTCFIDLLVTNYNDNGLSSIDNDSMFQQSRYSIYQRFAPWYLCLLVKCRLLLVRCLRRNTE
jgi:glycosyltransferase involved in cell wall biosynthesis